MSTTTAESRREATKIKIMGHFWSNDDDDHNDDDMGATIAINGTDKEHVRLMVQDLRTQLEQRKSTLIATTTQAKEEQHYAHSSCMMKLTKTIKKMTVREFNQKYSCDLIALIRSKQQQQQSNSEHKEGSSTTLAAAAAAISTKPPVAAASKKRIRPVMETPTTTTANKRGMMTPSTVRTVRRGEEIFSKNGSPVDTVDEGTLVATVSKKRRGKSSIVFDINVGEGRVINIANPGNVKHLDSSMKTEAKSQLLAMQEQMAALMAQLDT